MRGGGSEAAAKRQSAANSRGALKSARHRLRRLRRSAGWALARGRAFGWGHGIGRDPGGWVDGSRVLLCSFPSTPQALGSLQARGVSSLINLSTTPHASGRLDEFGMFETHLPVPDKMPPTADQLTAALQAIHKAVSSGANVAIHCSSGLGRSGSVAACYLVESGGTAREAIDQVRKVRPGAIPELGQVRTVAAYARSRRAQPTSAPGLPTHRSGRGLGGSRAGSRPA
jgi:atypical dual specificity phosphatase